MYIIFIIFALFVAYVLWIGTKEYIQIRKGKRVRVKIKSIHLQDKAYLIPPKVGIPIKIAGMLFGKNIFLGYDGLNTYVFEYELKYKGKEYTRTEKISTRKTLRDLRLKPGDIITVYLYEQNNGIKTKMPVSDSRPTLLKLIIGFIILSILLLLSYMDWRFGNK